jgi:hypothetical protein
MPSTFSVIDYICSKLDLSCLNNFAFFCLVQRTICVIHSGMISRPTYVKRVRGRPNLTWQESVKRDLKDWRIDKELALDRRLQRLLIHVLEHWLLVFHFFYVWFLPFSSLLFSSFPSPFFVFAFPVLWLMGVSSLAYPTCLGLKGLCCSVNH